MEIADIKATLVFPGGRKNLCFVNIDTDDGIHGWGECYTRSDRDVQITAHIDQFKRYLVGRDPMNIKHLVQVAYDDFAARRGGMDFYCALSGIDQALWDIKGKVYGVPVYKLLGGPTRDRVRVYGEVSEKTGVSAMKVGPRSLGRTPIKYLEGQRHVGKYSVNP